MLTVRCSSQVLHLLMCQLESRQMHPVLWAFLQVDERLVDIGDDLVDYEASTQLLQPACHARHTMPE